MKEITSSMAGTVFNVITEVGQSVTAGQTLLVLESMKMEIPVESTEAGEVVEIKVNIGDFVNEGDILVVLK
ncbi:acetyl-CoA carboxylase biotin carboxyl carrier protein subunit [Bacillus suaedaesalsae]|uniref:Acetyl-CoA carboxylase biotin carboxyl carrier protein subunit n=1 Tax=Bacillus suaedaesalsae TaxID=2810349 RepID=A0ABS2DJ90_9BACI|nr:acetyl-CoA carboxylase biotin carboxyl carrier protein subunit [Bacillus suaedaesalsae]MBM6618560.1 acetyl-CoA carboxylase biotin carboxyl carrier protein subunit [Bacillus suaedaesalsae]